ncbi:MAG: PIG-L family deacetylase [Syntrophomonadaceae bacterium]
MNRKRLVLGAVGTAILTIYLVIASVYNTQPQSVFYKMEEVPAPLPGQRILVFAPHPDDESIAVGGYLYTCHEVGAQVEVVLVTDGNRRGLRDKRYQEFKAAASHLGLETTDLRFWNYPDGRLSASLGPLTDQVREEISSFQPQIVVYSNRADRHPDHATLGAAVEKVLGEGKLEVQPVGYAYLVHYQYYPRPALLSRQHHLLPPKSAAHADESWEKFSLSPEAREAKYEAIHCYSSQLRNPLLKHLFTGLLQDNELLSRDQLI